MASDAQRKILISINKRHKRFSGFCAALLILSIISTLIHDSRELPGRVVMASSPQEKETVPEVAPKVPVDPWDLTRLDHCANAVPNVKALSEAQSTAKPILLTAAPFTFSFGLNKKLIDKLTGTLTGSKYFYTAVRHKIKHCIGHGLTVTCGNEHPYIEMSGFPKKFYKTFHSKYIMVLRNPMTSFPASFYGKSARYSNTVGQLPEKEWRMSRDIWFGEMVEEWKKMIVTWHKTKYELGMYIVYDDLFDAAKGPGIMKELRSLVKDAGFNVAPEEDLDCIWYNAVGKANLEKFHTSGFEYDDYIPGYTQEQKVILLQELQTLKIELRKDERLGRILDRYIQEIMINLRIDERFRNYEESVE